MQLIAAHIIRPPEIAEDEVEAEPYDWRVDGKATQGLVYGSSIYQPLVFKHDQSDWTQYLLMNSLGKYRQLNNTQQQLSTL